MSRRSLLRIARPAGEVSFGVRLLSAFGLLGAFDAVAGFITLSGVPFSAPEERALFYRAWASHVRADRDFCGSVREKLARGLDSAALQLGLHGAAGIGRFEQRRASRRAYRAAFVLRRLADCRSGFAFVGVGQEPDTIARCACNATDPAVAYSYVNPSPFFPGDPFSAELATDAMLWLARWLDPRPVAQTLSAIDGKD